MSNYGKIDKTKNRTFSNQIPMLFLLDLFVAISVLIWKSKSKRTEEIKILSVKSQATCNNFNLFSITKSTEAVNYVSNEVIQWKRESVWVFTMKIKNQKVKRSWNLWTAVAFFIAFLRMFTSAGKLISI